MEPVALPVAVRAWVEPVEAPKAKRVPRRDPGASNPRVILVFDTETTIDATQQLNFGAWQAYARPEFPNELEGLPDWHDYQLIDQGLFYADNLAERYPEGLAVLRAHAETTEAYPHLKLHSRREWLSDVLYPLMFKSQGLVVGFNLPFDLSRIAIDVTPSQSMAGGFSFVIAGYHDADGVLKETQWKQRVAIKALDSKRSFIELRSAAGVSPLDRVAEEDADGEPDTGSEKKRRAFRGRFLDLRTLAFALTDESYTLERACTDFGVADGKTRPERHGEITPEYIEYCRQDVRATWQLYCKLREEYERHPISLPPTRAYSPASIGKAYLDAMKITPVLQRQPDFPREVLGYAMAAYYGGRAECRIRRAPVPIVYLDFLSMYPTVNTLLGNWQLLTAKKIDVEPAADEVRAFLERVTLGDLFEPATWHELSCLVKIEPDNDVLPVRARYGFGNEWQIGLNPLTSERRMWYTLADVVAAKLLSGKVARVIDAVRLVARGRLTGIKPIELRRSLRVDPKTEDFFQRVIELRKGSAGEDARLGDFLKVLANSASYGIFAEMNRDDQARKPKNVERFGLDRQRMSLEAPEEGGRWCFPPLAASIAGAARLMLAMLERCVIDAGGSYVFCDTDSMAIVATKTGELVECPGGPHRAMRRDAIRALSWAEVDAMVTRFDALKLYDPAAVRASVLKIEDENYDDLKSPDRQRTQLYCYAISAKRYCLFNLETGQPALRKSSESGLGHLMDPLGREHDPAVGDPDQAALPKKKSKATREWIRKFWERTLREVYRLPTDSPDWFDRIALSRFTVSTASLLDNFERMNAGKEYRDRVKPFNFILIAHDASIGADRKTLIAPYERDAAKWIDLPWRDRRDGRRYYISTRPSAGGMEVVRVSTYQDVYAAHRVHVEAKSLAPDGAQCRRDTVGLLRRTPVTPLGIEHIGKEAHRLEEAELGLVAPDEAYNVLEDRWELVRQVLAKMSISEAQRLSGLKSRSAVMELRAGSSRSSKRRRAAITAQVVAWVRERLAGVSTDTSSLRDVEVVRAWLE